MQNIEFLGSAGGEVTGSSFLLTAADSNQVLVDFGMFQGKKELVNKNYDLLTFDPSALQAVFVTHAHLDHCGRLPLLVYGGYFGKIYVTAPSRSFIEIILSDSAHIAARDFTREPLYTLDEVDKVMKMMEVVEYDKEFTTGSFSAVFRDAGHILGSASIEITDLSDDKKPKIVFSGDLGNTPQSIVKPTSYIDSAHFVVMESTYGDSSHPQENPEEIIKEEINTVEQSGGVLLIPAFALERTQEVLHIINHLKNDGKIAADTPVYLDSPMGINATAVYLEFKDFYNDEIKSHIENPFSFEGLIVTGDAKESKEISKEQGSKVIIAGSGMMSGGRILHHAVNYLGAESTRLLFVGYQAEETNGREILQGMKQVMIDKIPVRVKAHIREIKTLSSHADQPRLLSWLGHIKGVKKVFLTHGEGEQRRDLAEKIKSGLGIKEVILPENEEIINLN